MRNKLILGILLFFFCICGFIVALVIVLRQNNQLNTSYLSPSVSPSPTIQHVTPSIPPLISIISAEPEIGAKNIPINTSLSISLNTPLLLSQLYFSITPSVAYTIQAQNSIYLIHFQSPLQPNTTYIYYIGNKEQVTYQGGMFSTVVDATTPQQDIQSVMSDAYNLHNEPDLFLKNKTPYTMSGEFSITGMFTSTPNDHYAFTVTFLDTNTSAAKQSLQTWLLSLGLNQTQINSLDFSYH